MEMQWRIMYGLTKAQDGVARWMHVLILIQSNGCSINIWNEHTPFECKSRDQSIHLLILGARQQDQDSMNAHILSNPHVRQKQNEKKTLDQVKKKVELKWDELQAYMQQMEQVKRPLFVHLASKMMLGIIGILAWGVGFIPQSAWAHLETDENLVEAI